MAALGVLFLLLDSFTTAMAFVVDTFGNGFVADSISVRKDTYGDIEHWRLAFDCQ